MESISRARAHDGMVKKMPNLAESRHPAHKKTIGVSHLSARHHWKPFNLIWAHPEWTDLEILEISDFWDFQVPRYLKSGLGRAGLGPWVGPGQCCAGARRRAAGAPAQHCHGPTRGPKPGPRPKPGPGQILEIWGPGNPEI